MNEMKKILSVLIIAGLIISCGSNKNIMKAELVPGPKALIYKTRADYYDKVPIGLSADKKQVVSYPDPSDLRTGETWLMPTKLTKGYLLDNKGIGVNVAFLKYSYAEYAALTELPEPQELMQAIIDPDPITELWDCGMRSEFNNIRDLKQIIRDNFTGCKKLK